MAMLRSQIRKFCLRLLLALRCIAAAALPAGAQDTLDKLNLTITFVRLRDQTQKPIANDLLTSSSAVVGPNDSISDLLRRNGIFPNTDAMAVVFSLNPNLTRLSPLPAKLTIKLPDLKKTEEVNSGLREGFLASLTVDQKLKDDLMATWKSLHGLVTQISAFGPERFTQAEDKEKVVTALENISESLHDITIVLRENSRPLSHEMLRQTYNEAVLLQSIVQEAVQSDQKLSAADQNRILLIGSDMELKMQNLDEARGPNNSPLRWRDTRVIVEVVQDQRPVPSWRVYYVPEALFGRNDYVQQFSVLTSPAEDMLPEADYVMWASKEGVATMKTAQIKLQVRKNAEGTMRVQLVPVP